MFTVQQIKAAHSKVKTGADFPKYVREISDLGLKFYEFFVKDGAIIYHGDGNYAVSAEALYASKDIAEASSAEALRHNITIHQQGQTNFPTFCEQAAAAGVEKWVVDTQKMCCTYYDLKGREMVAEPIPENY